ncbi:hypothetical protein WME90_07275 [Sorangium sp. So ce375]|uniref:aromatic-ring hydroxylase C-terminal domain-containing protein n=1 Tax=Sorangium sp. So ce375 TaxID=3133306 RepID=UPI003F5C497C
MLEQRRTRTEQSRALTVHPSRKGLPLREAGAAWGDRVDVVRATAAPESDLAAVDAVLVRPDGHVAWASEAARRATRLADLRSALESWCGPA